MIKVIVSLFLLMFIFQLFSQVLAKTNELVPKEQLQSLGFTDYESINSNSLLYQFKRLSEEAKFFFIFNEDAKNKYTRNLVKTRFNELIYIINFEKTGFLAETVNRYNAFIGKTKVYFPKENSPTVYKVDPNSSQVKRFVDILEKLRDMYPANSAYWLYIQQAIDSTKNLK